MALGDVSGKGTAAALFASLAIGIVREHIVEHPCPPAEMLRMLNSRLYSVHFDSRFIATLFWEDDASTRRLTISNGGGPYPLLVRDGAVQSVRVAGIPLGLFPDTQYDEVTLELARADTVLFASDGILEAFNADLEEFGADRLDAVLSGVSPDQSAEDIAALILAATDDYSGALRYPIRRPHPPGPSCNRPQYFRLLQAADHLLTRVLTHARLKNVNAASAERIPL